MTRPAQTAERLPTAMGEERRALVGQIADALATVEGISAIALGGSWARGTAGEASDIDLGIYYREAAPFRIGDVRSSAVRFAAGGDAVVSGFYEWGPWVNGGAWVPTRVGRIDLLYRSLDQLRAVIEDAKRGVLHCHYFQQPAYGFYSVIFLADASASIPLHDPAGILPPLAREVSVFPPALARTIVQDQLWGAEFSLGFAAPAAQRGDPYIVAGCVTRVLGYLTQVIYALNETYFPGDKGALERIGTFPLRPEGYVDRVHDLLASTGRGPGSLTATVGALRALFQEVAGLAGDRYAAKTKVPPARPAHER